MRTGARPVGLGRRFAREDAAWCTGATRRDETGEAAKEAIPDGEDRAEVLPAGGRDVVEVVQSWHYEDRLDPTRSDT